MKSAFSKTISLSSSLRTSSSLQSHSRLSSRFFSNTTRTMASTQVGQDISATAKAEGGPQKGSTSAQMQSEVGKTRNFEQAAAEVGSKMQSAPESVTSEDAAYIHRREARATGTQNPPPGSITSEAQHLSAENEGATKSSTSTTASSGNVPPQAQSQLDKEANFQQAAADVVSKMQTDPNSVTKEDGDLLHRREQRAHGHTEKQGVAAQAQSLAAENEKKGLA